MRQRFPVGKLEPELLAELLGGLHIDDPAVIVGPGIGRDVAVLEWGEGDSYLIAKTDPITFATDEIGHYAVCVNTNDVATSGGLPRWFLATLLLPDEQSDETLVRTIFEQIDEACRDLGIALVGGHTEVTYDLGRPILVGLMIGEVEKQNLVTSDGAQAGDRLLLTKRVAVEGTCIIAREMGQELIDRGFDEETVRQAAGMLHDPGISVLAEARAAVSAGQVHAMHDPTEGGIATGLHELAMASDTGIQVAHDQIPFYPETEGFCEALGIEPLGLIGSGSLLIAAPPGDAERITEAVREKGVECADIGEVVEPERGIMIRRGLNWCELPRYDQDEIAKLY
ncbi:MAG: AIR synthase family protein [Armatimonadota bacterium]